MYTLMQVREIQLSNPTRRPLSYAARLEGAADFSLEASLVKIDPGQSTQVRACSPTACAYGWQRWPTLLWQAVVHSPCARTLHWSSGTQVTAFQLQVTPTTTLISCMSLQPQIMLHSTKWPKQMLLPQKCPHATCCPHINSLNLNLNLPPPSTARPCRSL
jgi:hypothetical protein